MVDGFRFCSHVFIISKIATHFQFIISLPCNKTSCSMKRLFLVPCFMLLLASTDFFVCLYLYNVSLLDIIRLLDVLGTVQFVCLSVYVCHDVCPDDLTMKDWCHTNNILQVHCWWCLIVQVMFHALMMSLIMSQGHKVGQILKSIYLRQYLS